MFRVPGSKVPPEAVQVSVVGFGGSVTEDRWLEQGDKTPCLLAVL